MKRYLKSYMMIRPFIMGLISKQVCMLGAIFLLTAQSPPDRQYQVKAAFLYNFTQFVEWPSNSFLESTAPIVIAVIGDDPFEGYLDQVISGEKMGEHPINVRHFSPDDEVKDCHFLFINISEKEKTREIIERVKGQSVLTVSDRPGFLQNGGMIKFITINNKIHFRINPSASNSAHLQISSKLLRLAEIFSPK